MNRLQMLCRRALCVPIRIYQYTLSPWIGRSCRFSPSCSNYTMQAILTHGCVHKTCSSPFLFGGRGGRHRAAAKREKLTR